MKIAFCTHCSDDWYFTIGCDKLVRSSLYFYPEIPFYIFGDEQIRELKSIHPNVGWNTIHPFVSLQLIDDYDLIVHFDADSMIVGKLDELLDENNLKYQIIGVRNNNDFDKAGKDNAISEGKIPENYLNAGLVATPSKIFLEDWCNRNMEYANNLPFQEQSVLNQMTSDYSTKILDSKSSNVYYGVSGLYGNKTHWDSWKEIEVENQNLTLNNKIVKVLHHGGGNNPTKLGFNLFSDNVQKRLNEICQY